MVYVILQSKSKLWDTFALHTGSSISAVSILSPNGKIKFEDWYKFVNYTAVKLSYLSSISCVYPQCFSYGQLWALLQMCVENRPYMRLFISCRFWLRYMRLLVVLFVNIWNFIQMPILLIFSFADWFFPYLSIGISMITNAIHYSVKLDQSFKALIRSSLLEIKNFVIICKLIST